MRVRKVFIILISLFVTNILAQSSSVSKTGTTAAAFLEIAAGGTAIGMGGAFVSVANDASALYWNPSGIAELDKKEILVSHTDWIAETNYDFAGLIIPLGNLGNIGLSFTSLTMDDIKVRTIEKPDGTGEFYNASDLAIGLSYARKITERFSIGFTAKYIKQSIWHMSASTVAIDAGTKFRTDLFGGMVIGASISNFGPSMQLEGRDTRYFIRVDESKLGSNENIPTNIELDSFELPLLFQLGISTYILNLDDYSILLAIDAMHPNNNKESMNIGTEIKLMQFFYLRGGYKDLFLEDSEGGLSLGIGVNSEMLFSDSIAKFDYAYRDFGRLKDVHTFSVSITF